LTSFAQFKDQVARLRDSRTPEEQVARVFLGGTPAAPDEQRTCITPATLNATVLAAISRLDLQLRGIPAQLTLRFDGTHVV
jgi:hypothetical protein